MYGLRNIISLTVACPGNENWTQDLQPTNTDHLAETYCN
jgi:hypothetical protein